MSEAEVVTACLLAWRKSVACSRWPSTADVLLVAVLVEDVIFWPALRGVPFDIVRLRDSVVLDEDALPWHVARALDWRVSRLAGASLTIQ